ncbi:MAG: D-sedoheptulose-7-phosphate isomerase [Aureliella sp.]
MATVLEDRITSGQRIQGHLLQSARVLQRTAEVCPHSILHTAELITECFQQRGKLLICGNGGSAAESQHLAAEFTHRLSAAVIRRALPALALTTDTSFLTAFANDDGYERVFARQVEALGQPGDVLLGISTSGNSANVVAAMHQAHAQGLKTIALTGASGEMVRIADAAICIPATETQPVQEAQLAVLHILCALVETAFVTELGSDAIAAAG